MFALLLMIFMYYNFYVFCSMLALKNSMYIPLLNIVSPCQKQGRSDLYPYMLKVANWYGLECVEVKDVYSDVARKHSRQKLQAPTHALKVNDLIKDQQLKFM